MELKWKKRLARVGDVEYTDCETSYWRPVRRADFINETARAATQSRGSASRTAHMLRRLLAGEIVPTASGRGAYRRVAA